MEEMYGSSDSESVSDFDYRNVVRNLLSQSLGNQVVPTMNQVAHLNLGGRNISGILVTVVLHQKQLQLVERRK